MRGVSLQGVWCRPWLQDSNTCTVTSTACPPSRPPDTLLLTPPHPHLYVLVEPRALRHELLVCGQQLGVLQLVGIHISLKPRLTRCGVLQLALKLVVLLLWAVTTRPPQQCGQHGCT